MAQLPFAHTVLTDGLSSMQAQERLARDGPNEIPTSQPRRLLALLRDIVLEPMLLLLVACGVIYLVLGRRQDAFMLMCFVVIVIGITFFQQRKAEHSLNALRELSSPLVTVLRDGTWQRKDGRALVCGDIVALSEGDRIPADMEVLVSANLSVDESMLTGESVPVSKQARPSPSPSPNVNVNVHDVVPRPAAGNGDVARVFSGTLVTQGAAQCCVSATGERSTLGKIGQSLTGLGDESTLIQQETRRVVKWVAWVGLLLAAALTLTHGVVAGDWLHGLLAGLTLAMAILPEELPVVLTLFLALGAWRLARAKVLTRNMSAMGLLGATTVLCVDKTGTLTTNRMAVRQLWNEVALFDSAPSEVPVTASAIFSALPPSPPTLPSCLHEVLEFAVLASHRRAFDPMEVAITEAGQALLADTEHLHTDWTLVDDYPLSAEMLAMSRVWRSPGQHLNLIAAKGAPEAIVDLCHLDPATAERIAQQVAVMAAQGLRVLGVAQATFAVSALPDNQHAFAFAFLGLVGLQDPLRLSVAAAIANCHAAGIRVVMMTGDHPATALAIAKQAGLPVDSRVMTGAELAEMADSELVTRLASTGIFCRVQPEQKLRLVQAFRARGDIVVMTGDGINDAPALKAAHIGVAMGLRGTDVAREAADLVLLDDDFSALVIAMAHGRRVFVNLRKAIVFLVAVHVPIVGLSVFPVVLGWPMLLMPVHILVLQIIIDPACTLVFEAEPLEPGTMQLAPRRADARLFDVHVVKRGLLQGLGLWGVLMGAIAVARALGVADDVVRAQAFAVLALSSLGLIHANRAWYAPSTRGRASANRAFSGVALTALVLLCAALGVSAVRQVFYFGQPTFMGLLGVVVAAMVSFMWFLWVSRWSARSLVLPSAMPAATPPVPSPPC